MKIEEENMHQQQSDELQKIKENNFVNGGSGNDGGKIDKVTDTKNIDKMLNPFVHKLELETSSDKIMTFIFTIFVLPIRLVLICILLVTAWSFACIGLYGVSEKELATVPMKGWRFYLKYVISMVGRWSYMAGGMSIQTKGIRAKRNEAAILVLGPHSTFLDAVIVYVTNMASIIVRKESMDNYAGKLINFTQPIYVWRDDPNSRQNTIKEIIERANSKDDWPQIIIFPEGTCTNRSCLINFKPGAFYPGVPVQPVCIRYPNRLDTVTWTWEGPGFFKLLWLTLTRIHSHCEIEFLPVYTPNEEEKRDPKLYAKNVRDVMAKALGVPVSDYTFNDCKILTRAKKMNITNAADIVEIEKLRQIIGYDKLNVEEELITGNLVKPKNSFVSLAEFQKTLRVPFKHEITATKLFNIFDSKQKRIDNTIDLREYIICALFIIKRNEPIISMVNLISKMYEQGDIMPGALTQDGLYATLKCTLAMTQLETDIIFKQINTKNQLFIQFNDLQDYLKTRQEYQYIFTNNTESNLKSKND